MTTNPFFFGNEVSGTEFCNRVKELEELKNDVAAGLNVLLYAPRRFGKTSLLKKLKSELDSNDSYKVIFFDFFSVSSVDEFIQKYFDTLARGLETTTDKIIELFKSTLTIKPNITVNISQNGESTFGLGFSRSEQSRTLEEVLSIPFEYAKKIDKKIVVIFDEFQEIEQFDIEKKLRSIIQSHGRSVSYIFCGSKKSILTEMFSDESRAFYKSVKHVPINEITLDDWIEFANKKFTQTNKVVTNEQIAEIFNCTSGFPYYMQQLLFTVWDITDNTVQDYAISKALSLTIEREYDLYSLIWSSLTPNQKKCLKYIIAYQAGNLYANDKLADFGMSATTLKSTLEALIKKDVIDRKNEVYYLIDPFMRQWVQRL